MLFVLFFKQKTAYEMRISDWSSDVCSSDLVAVTPSISLPVSLNPTTSGISIDTGWPSIAASASIFALTPAERAVVNDATAVERRRESGRATRRERGSQYVSIPVVAVPLKTKTTHHYKSTPVHKHTKL